MMISKIMMNHTWSALTSPHLPSCQAAEEEEEGRSWKEDKSCQEQDEAEERRKSILPGFC
jgi:hypothetical protein